MNLNAAGVMELSAAEMGEVDGGSIIRDIYEIAKDIYENWDTYVADFNKAFAAGQKVIK